MAAAAEAAESDAARGDGFRGMLAYMRCMLCRHGTAQMRADAQIALQALDAHSSLRAGVLVCEALSYLLDDELDLADPILAHAYDVGLYTQAGPATAAAAALRGLVALRHKDWDEAQEHANLALSVVEARHLQDYLEASIVYAVAAHVASHRGDVRASSDYLAELCDFVLC